ncbi:hypothetical protein PSPO01_06985 [Paraphaeosphaeria sporulosa]
MRAAMLTSIWQASRGALINSPSPAPISQQMRSLVESARSRECSVTVNTDVVSIDRDEPSDPIRGVLERRGIGHDCSKTAPFTVTIFPTPTCRISSMAATLVGSKKHYDMTAFVNAMIKCNSRENRSLRSGK